MEANILDAALQAVLIVMAASPAICLLCISDKGWHYALAITLFVVSLMGFMGMKYTSSGSNTPVVNNLYNYGEEIK